MIKRLLVISGLMVAIYTSHASAGFYKDGDLILAKANAWFEFVDDGQYELSWDKASKILKGNVSKKDWMARIQKFREMCGPFISRKIYSLNYSDKYPKGPNGLYCILYYYGVYENKSFDYETLVMVLEEGEWRVFGYYWN